MTIEEYKEKINELEKEFETKKITLWSTYASANNSVQIGDIITDHQGSLKVERIGTFIKNEQDAPSECYYYGIIVLKNGAFKKVRGKDTFEYRKVYQSNIIK